MKSLRRNQSGAASLELLIVLVPWVIIIFIFFNLLFLLSSLMINQSAVNRAAQQVAAVGCIPDGLVQQVTDTAFGVDQAEFVAIAPSPKPDGRANPFWDRSRYLDSNGRVDRGQGTAIKSCLASNERLPSGNYIFVQLQYDQNLPVLAVLSAAGVPSTLQIERSALVNSQSLEGQ